MIACKRQSTFEEISEEIAKAMNPRHRTGVIAQLQFEHVDVSPVLKLLPEKLIGISLHGFERLFETTTSHAFSYTDKKWGSATALLGLRQYLPSRLEKDSRRDAYLMLQLHIPEARPALEKHVDDNLSLESELIYCVFMEAIVSAAKNTTEISLVFRKDGLCVFEEFWSSKPGRFFVSKYNDYFLN